MKGHLECFINLEINIWAQPFGPGFPLQCLNPAACPPAHCQSPGLPAAFPLQSLAPHFVIYYVQQSLKKQNSELKPQIVMNLQVA
ncbi:MAG: hypothetical protein B6D68_03645 [spirochete symbiont of Stewartia floridana]|nr:MAG: hypothetical protein B6D68_03645 [spirochete symbiont of Stewartia floridana]